MTKSKQRKPNCNDPEKKGKQSKPKDLEKEATQIKPKGPEKAAKQSKPKDPEKAAKQSKPKDPEKAAKQSKPKDPEKAAKQSKPKDPEKAAKQSKPKDPEKVAKQSKPKGMEENLLRTETTSKENQDQVTPQGLAKSVPADKQTELDRLDNNKNKEGLELNKCKYKGYVYVPVSSEAVYTPEPLPKKRRRLAKLSLDFDYM